MEFCADRLFRLSTLRLLYPTVDVSAYYITDGTDDPDWLRKLASLFRSIVSFDVPYLFDEWISIFFISLLFK